MCKAVQGYLCNQRQHVFKTETKVYVTHIPFSGQKLVLQKQQTVLFQKPLKCYLSESPTSYTIQFLKVSIHCQKEL